MFLGTSVFVKDAESVETYNSVRSQEFADLLTFSLEEMDGTVVASKLATPEPSTSMPLSLGAFGVCGWLSRRNKTAAIVD